MGCRAYGLGRREFKVSDYRENLRHRYLCVCCPPYTNSPYYLGIVVGGIIIPISGLLVYRVEHPNLNPESQKPETLSRSTAIGRPCGSVGLLRDAIDPEETALNPVELLSAELISAIALLSGALNAP